MLYTGTEAEGTKPQAQRHKEGANDYSPVLVFLSSPSAFVPGLLCLPLGIA